MTDERDVIVIGAGSMGAAAAYHIARRGLKVLALDQYDVPNTQGSHHGESRLIRFAYKEGDAYVPLLLRARDLWRDLESETNEKLFYATGGLTIAAAGAEGSLEGVYRSAKNYDIPHKVFSGRDVNKLYPAFRLPDNVTAVHDSWAGYILSEKAITVFARAARARGAEIRTGVKVLSWKSGGSRVTVTTDDGILHARKLVIAPGAWFSKMVPEFQPVLQTKRTAVSWYRPARLQDFMPERLPVFTLAESGDNGCYGVPVCEGSRGIKIGPNQIDESVDPDAVDRAPSPADAQATRYWADRYFNLTDAEHLGTAMCMYTDTPDKAFILGTHPAHENVMLGHACSGHGFKFAPVIGEILADFAVDGGTKHDISAHRPGRFV